MATHYFWINILLSSIISLQISSMSTVDAACPSDSELAPCYCEEQTWFNTLFTNLYCSPNDPEWDLSATFQKICGLNTTHYTQLIISDTNLKTLPENAISCSIQVIMLSNNSLLESIDVNAFTSTENTSMLLIMDSPRLHEGTKDSETDIFKFLKQFPKLDFVTMYNLGLTRIRSGGISLAGPANLEVYGCAHLTTIENDAFSNSKFSYLYLSENDITSCGLGRFAFRGATFDKGSHFYFNANPRLTYIKESTVSALLDQVTWPSIAMDQRSCAPTNNCYGYGLYCKKMTWFCNSPSFSMLIQNWNFHCKEEKDPNYDIRKYCENLVKV